MSVKPKRYKLEELSKDGQLRTIPAKPVQMLSEALSAVGNARTPAAPASSSEEVVLEFDQTNPTDTALMIGLGGIGYNQLAAPWSASATLEEPVLYSGASRDGNEIYVSELANNSILIEARLPYYIAGKVPTKTMTKITSKILGNDVCIYSNPAYKIFARHDGLYVYFLTDEGTNPYSRLILFTTVVPPETVRLDLGSGEMLTLPSDSQFHTEVWNDLTFEGIPFRCRMLTIRANLANSHQHDFMGDFVYMGDGDIPASTPIRMIPEDNFKTGDDRFLYQIYQSEKYDVVLTGAGIVLWSHKEPIAAGTEIKFKGTIYLAGDDNIIGHMPTPGK